MERIVKLRKLVSLIRESYIPAVASYDVVVNSSFEDQYSLATGLINNSTMYILEAQSYYESNIEDLERHDFESYFETFSDYKYELFEVIKKKDRNTSWLSSRKDGIDHAKRNVEGLLKIMNENYEEELVQREMNRIKPSDVSKLVKAPKYN